MITATLNDNGTVSLVGKQGTTWDIVLSVFSDNEATVPFNLADYSARGQYRKDYKITSPPLITFECAVLPLNAQTNPGQNKISIHADASASTACFVYSGVYDIEIYTEDEESVERVMEGSLVISREVTKDAE